MNPSSSRKRENVKSSESGTSEQTSPPRKRATRSSLKAQLNTDNQQVPSTQVPDLPSQPLVKNEKKTTKSTKSNKSTKSTRVGKKTASTLNQCTSLLKFPTLPAETRQTASLEPISTGSALSHPTKLIPLTAETRALKTIQQLISEKLREMRNDNLVLLKSPTPDKNESEICLTVVEVTSPEDTTSSDGSETVNYSVLQEDISDSADLYKVILEKITKRTQSSAKESNENSEPTAHVQKIDKNKKYAKQIEREVIKTITALRKKNKRRKGPGGPYRANQDIFVMFVDGRKANVTNNESFTEHREDTPENIEREQQFIDIFDTIFQKVSAESNKPELSNAVVSKVEEQKENQDKKLNSIRRFDRRADEEFYPCTNLDNFDKVTIGPDGTKIPLISFLKINWWQWPAAFCTKVLVPLLFDRESLSKFCLRKSTPATCGLNPMKLRDLYRLITDCKPGSDIRDVFKGILVQGGEFREQDRQRRAQEQPKTETTNT